MTDVFRTTESLRSLIYETPCSSLSALDRALLIERDLGDVFEVVGSEDLQSQLDDMEADNENLTEEVAECRKTMKALVDAIEELQLWSTDGSSLAKVGTLIVSDVGNHMRGNSRHALIEALAAAKLETKKIIE